MGLCCSCSFRPGSFDTNFHIFLASHYAHHWFNPWNEKWFAGFSQTTYPPLTHQWIALLSNVTGLKMGYMLVQLMAVLLLPVGVFRFARIWVDDRAASYAALGSIFLGALAFLVYQAGQLATVASAALYLNALPYFYEWATQASGRSLIKGVAVSLTAAAAHHVTLIFGIVLFAGPVLWIACMDARDERVSGSLGGVVSRALLFAVSGGGRCRDCSLALLDGSHSASHSPDSDSARQPHELSAELDHGNQLFRDSLRRADSGSAIHSDSRLVVAPPAAVARRILADVDLRIGRNDSTAEMAVGASIRDSDFRAIYLLGDADGDADRRAARH